MSVKTCQKDIFCVLLFVSQGDLVTHTGEGEIQFVNGRLPDNPGVRVNKFVKAYS